MSENVILGFIKHFSGATDTFLNGCCYWFTVILTLRFGGETLYSPIENHFVQKIGEQNRKKQFLVLTDVNVN